MIDNIAKVIPYKKKFMVIKRGMIFNRGFNSKQEAEDYADMQNAWSAEEIIQKQKKKIKSKKAGR